ncbi:MAG: glycosyltransferase family 2 protein [Gammaproteobacteria bacterium]
MELAVVGPIDTHQLSSVFTPEGKKTLMINSIKVKEIDLIREVQSKLMPLSPLERMLERIILMLPRKFLEVELISKEEVEIIDSERGRYESTGSNPRFSMKIDSYPPKKGWYYLESALTRPNGDRTAKIYFDRGHGYSESECIFIPSNLRGSIREVFYLPGDVRALRWDPTESFGAFTQSPLVIHRITGLESFFRRAWRVLFDIWRFRNKPPQARAGLTLSVAIKNLRDAYSRSANLRRGGYVQEGDYVEWICRYDTLNDAKRTRIVDRIAAMPSHPLISVVMPCYNPKPEWFKEAIESIRSQLYPRWELCVADDASTDPRIRKILESYLKIDGRIKVVFRQRNGHISAASNSALEIATGEYVALVDHDDLLPEHALFWVADIILRHPDSGLIYSDEDKIDESGLRSGPYFKCDFNYDLFLSHNMICHLGVYKTEQLRRIGGFREGFEGSQDWDLALRCVEQLKPSEIVHIPRVLYHWRMHPESTALKEQEAKPYVNVAAEKALNEHFERRHIAARAELIPEVGFLRTRYVLPERLPMVTLIIPTRNELGVLCQCVTSILKKTAYPNYEILIVDNGSDDPDTLAYFNTIRGNPRIRILRDDGPFNFSALNNRAVREARGELIGLINNDIEVINGEWLSEMVSIALQPGVGAVGARLWYPDDTLQHGGVIVGIGGVAGHSHKFSKKGSPGYFDRAVLTQSFSAVTGACLIVSKSIYEDVGGLDEENLQVAFNDVDFCLRVRDAGYRNVWTPFADLYHHESVSRGQEDSAEKQARFAREVAYMQQRWGESLLKDPAYSPNLTLDRVDFSYAWPPRVELI